MTTPLLAAVELVVFTAAMRAGVFLVAAVMAARYSWRISVLLGLLFLSSLARAVGYDRLNSVVAVPVAVLLCVALVTFAGHERIQRRLP